MVQTSTRWVVAAGLLILGCGDGRARADADGSGSGSESLGGTSAADTSAGSAAETSGGSQSGTDGGGTTSGGDDAADSPVIFDVATMPDGGEGCGGEGGVEFSYIWISNSPEGTVSKINTETRIEEARYTASGNAFADPSRTSVSLKGDVAVVDRSGAITKIWAREADCVDQNANNMIETSTGPGDIKPWGQDECVAWSTPLPSAARPAAWTSGDEIGSDGCGNKIYENEKVWTSAPDPANFSDAIVYLVDGETGVIEDQVTVPGANGGLGIYGGAVDPDNDFWGVTYSAGPLVHVRIADMTYETIPLPIGSAYGFTVDSKGRSWVGGWDGNLQRYDPSDQSWVSANIPLNVFDGLSRGMMEDQQGHLWVAALGFGVGEGILRVDTDTAAFIDLVDAAQLPGVNTPTGASVDVDGIVWMVDQSKDGGGAWVYDPNTDTADWVGGLVGPYTYSDMTGWALANVAKPSG